MENTKIVKRRRLRREYYYFLLAFFISLFLATCIFFGKWLYDNYRTKNLHEEIMGTSEIEEVTPDNEELVNPPEEEESDYWYYIKLPMINVNFQELQAKNSDTVAWIKVEGTLINYPVVQTTDNKYYLTHAFDKSRNSAGWVFSDYRNQWENKNKNKNTIIYGHGRLDKTVFGSLKNVLTDSWQSNKDNFVVKISTPTENTLWQVFSVYTVEPENYYLQNHFASNEAYQSFIDTIVGRSNYAFGTTVSTEDKILTLSTCTSDNLGRVVLHAKLIKSSSR